MQHLFIKRFFLGSTLALLMALGKADSSNSLTYSKDRTSSRSSFPKINNIYFDDSGLKNRVDYRRLSQAKSTIVNQSEPEMKTYSLDDFSRNLLESAFLVAQRISDPAKQTEQLTQVAVYYAQFGQGSRAAEILARARVAIDRIQEPAVKVRAMSALAGKYEALKLPEERNTILTEALNIVTTTSTNSSAMQESLQQLTIQYYEAGKLEQALKIIARMDDLFHRKYFNDFLSVLAARGREEAVRGRVEAGQYEEALQLIQNRIGSSDQQNLNIMELVRLTRQYGAAGQSEFMDRAIAEQLRLINVSGNPWYRVTGQINAAQQYAEAGQKDKAIELLNQAFQSAQQLIILPEQTGWKTIEKLRSLSLLAEGFALMGSDESALQTIDAVNVIPGVQNVLSWKAETLTQVGSTLAQKGYSNKATQVLEQATELLERLPDGEDKTNSLVWAAFAYIDASQPEKAKAIVARVRQISKYLDDDMQRSLAFLLQQTDEPEQALQVAIGNKDDDMLSNLVRNYSTTHQFNKALAVISKIESVSMKVEALAVISVEYAKTGQKIQALSTMQQAFALIETAKAEDPSESDLEYRQSQLASVLIGYLDANDPETFWTLINSIQDASTRFNTLSKLALRLEQVSQSSPASTPNLLTQVIAREWKIAQTLPDTASDSSSRITRDDRLAILARQFVSVGQVEQALQVVASLNNSPAKSRALLQIAEQHTELKQPIDDRFMRILQVIMQQLN